MKLYDNVLKKVEVYEDKRGIRYAKPDGKLYKYVKALYVIAFIYALAVNLLFALGVSMSDTLLHYMKNPLYTVLGLEAGLIAALVLTAFKSRITAALCSVAVNILSCTGLVLTFAPLLENEVGGYKASFYWRHFVPLCIVLLINLVLNVLVIRANLKTRKTYKTIVDNVYSTYHTSIEDGTLGEDEWEEVLKNI